MNISKVHFLCFEFFMKVLNYYVVLKKKRFSDKGWLVGARLVGGLVGSLVGALSDGLSGKLVGTLCRISVLVALVIGLVGRMSDACRTLVGRFSDHLGIGRAGHGCCQGPVGGLVGLPCRIFGWQETFLKDVSYESLVGGLFLEENDVGTCRGLVGAFSW